MLSQNSFAQQNKCIIYGTVYDKSNSETLAGASIQTRNSGSHTQGTTTDAYGRYSIWTNSPGDSAEIEISYLGYKTQKQKVSCLQNQKNQYNWHLEKDTFSLKDVTISALKKEKAINKKSSTFKLKPQELKTLPSLAGEKDLLKYFQLSPGVQLAGDVNSNLHVRGGNYDQNLFILDNMPLYHVSHFGGFLSTFNSDIIKTAELQKGEFPARYGGRLSSLVDVQTLDGDMHQHNFDVRLGYISSAISANGPIVKGNSSYLVSFRKNTLPFKWVIDIGPKYSFYDGNIKLNTILSENDRLYFSFYKGEDILKNTIKEKETINSTLLTGWGNTAASLRYNRIFSPKLFANFILGTSTYKYHEESDIEKKIDNQPKNTFKSHFTSQIEELFFKSHFNFSVGSGIRLFFGHDFSIVNNTPGTSEIKKQSSAREPIKEFLGYATYKTYENGLFCELDIKEIAGFSANMGVRGQARKMKETSFFNIEPRLSLSRKITESIALKTSWSQLSQSFHLAANNNGGIPVEYRIPAIKEAPPSHSRQIAAGGNFTSSGNRYEITLEGFLRSFRDLVTLKEGINFTADFRNLENIIHTNGRGESKGIELTFRKNKGKTTGWISSTLSKTTRQFEEINAGKPYPFRFDRRLDIKALCQYNFRPDLRFATTWTFGTGHPFTLPQSQMFDHENNAIMIYGKRNNFRESPYHRLDVSLQRDFKLGKIEGVLNLSVLNVYNRFNTHYHYIGGPDLHDFDAAIETPDSDKENPTLYKWPQIPFMPSLSVNLKF